MKHFRNFTLIILILISHNIMAQVGIGTILPDPSAALDITASDQGLLIPRVSLNDVSNTMLDGVNTAADGLLIWNSNAATVGGSGVGFYYFEGGTWIAIGSSTGGDADWFEEGTTSSPNSIADNIFTNGAVGINTNAVVSRGLNILSSTTETGSNWGIFNQSLNNLAGEHIGIENRMSGTGNSRKYGTLNEITANGFFPSYGTFNRISGTGAGFMYGSYNEINGAGTGSHIANYNAVASISNDNLYGNYNSISGNGTGPHYGAYNVLSGSGSGAQFATYNDVNVAGNGIHYGSQTVISGSADAEKYGNSVIIDNTGGGAHIGSTNSLEGAGTGTQTATNNIINNTGNSMHIGTRNTLIGTGSGSHYGTRNILQSSGTGSQYGIFNEVQNSANGIHYGSRNRLTGTGTGAKYGSHNYIDPAAGGNHYGVYSDVFSASGFSGYFKGRLAVGTNDATDPVPDFYTLPPSRGMANQIIETDGLGASYWTDNPAIITAENGLTEAAGVVRLGGTLNQNTSVAQSTFDMNFNLSSTGDFNVQDNGINHFQVRDNGNSYFGGEVVVAEDNVAGTTIARLFNISNQDGALWLYRNGSPQHRLDAGFPTIFNQQQGDFGLVVRGTTRPEVLGVDAGENIMFAGTDAVNLTNNGTTINGATVEYVAAFLKNAETNGTAIQMGTSEHIVDFGNFIMGPYANWSPTVDNNFDLGRSNFRWDDVYATAGVVNTSDIRLKKNIKELNYGLAEVMKLEPISYQWKHNRNLSEVKLGFSAQQLLEVIPEVVKTHDYVYPDEKKPSVLTPNENLGVYYSDIIPVLTKAIQEQQEIINALEQRLNALEGK